MRISIVTPVRDGATWIERCLRSVRGQEGVDVQHVVVDGGSTDGTVDVLAAQREVEWVSEPDRGQGDALRKGFARATGDAVGWLNADDELLPGALAAATAGLAGADAVYGDCDVTSAGASFIWKAPPRLDVALLAAGEIVPQPGSLVRRAAFDAVGGVDASFELAMDVALWAKLVAAGRPIAHVPSVLARFVVHEGSKTGSVARSAFLLEHARALDQAGLRRAGDTARGRAAALLVADESLGLSAALTRVGGDDPSLVVAAAQAELIVLAAKLRRPALARHGIAVGPFVHRETRRRLALAVRRAR